MGVRAVIVMLLVGLSGAYAHQLAAHSATDPMLPDLQQIPAAFEGWTSRDYPLSDNVAQILAADATLYRRYRHRDGTEVWFFLAYFTTQAVNSQIHSPKHCVPGNGWRVVSTQQEIVSLPSGNQPMARMLIEKQSRGQEICYWFRTRSGTLTGDYSLKWDQVKNALRKQPTDAAFIRYNADIEDADATRQLMARLDSSLNQLLGDLGWP